MSMPLIATDSKLAKVLAKTLNTKVDILAEKFGGPGEGNDHIDIYSMDKSKKYKDKIYYAGDDFGCDKCLYAFFVDNGDGKIGKGDLFLHFDGYYGSGEDGIFEEEEEPTFRYVKVGEKYEVQDESGWDARVNPKLTKEADKLLQAALAVKGKSFIDSTFESALKAVCGK